MWWLKSIAEIKTEITCRVLDMIVKTTGPKCLGLLVLSACYFRTQKSWPKCWSKEPNGGGWKKHKILGQIAWWYRRSCTASGWRPMTTPSCAAPPAALPQTKPKGFGRVFWPCLWTFKKEGQAGKPAVPMKGYSDYSQSLKKERKKVPGWLSVMTRHQRCFNIWWCQVAASKWGSSWERVLFDGIPLPVLYVTVSLIQYHIHYYFKKTTYCTQAFLHGLSWTKYEQLIQRKHAAAPKNSISINTTAMLDMARVACTTSISWNRLETCVAMLWMISPCSFCLNFLTRSQIHSRVNLAKNGLSRWYRLNQNMAGPQSSLKSEQRLPQNNHMFPKYKK